MIRDSKFSRRNSGKNLNFEETENIPLNVNLHELLVDRMSIDPCSRPPLNRIQEPSQNPSKPDQELGFKSSKIHRTPTKSKIRNPESGVSMRTPEKQGGLAKNRFGWGQDSRDEGRTGNVNTPRSCKTPGRPSLGFSEANSTLSTPTKSVSRPPNPSFRPPVTGGARTSTFTALSKGIPVICNTYTTVNTIEVPHFDLREDPSFWMDHNVQVLIRVRPLNGMEISSQGYSRCLKQESAQCLTWVGHPETRFTFDHVACETIDQETLFKMVGLPMVENCLAGYNSCMFAYGQTGSGKTHTMLGEINDLEVKPSPYRGMTPRIFEFLFARIIAEEESRKDERLKYNCKCSFLEIYNEQITDLLDPSSANLQLREDVKKGVYVENLTELEVHSVGDILKLLTQGSANRRVAATNMNRESSRSHSVFTCVIESRWEKDSTSNLRFARLNLVDLAGSERQKSSGAEGERLKEAANINKSLSTLGHVIMVLVDAVNARTRHVPYRDSKLTFLLQDSLGGNSKTMIIANVSPSLSSATETLNTLKFAQRAKLIQNNAVINEDASGDVAALQHQIRLLKEELAILKRHNISRSLSLSSKDENYSIASSFEMNRLKVDNVLGEEDMILRVSCKQLKSLESSLNGALRREKSTESCIKQLEAQIEQLNCLVHQREEEIRCTKMMLKFREDKIQRMEAVLAGSIAADSYLLEENNKLREEIRILSAKVDRNPEVTRFAVENIRLLEQLKRFQDFYEEGERETLLTEVSELRDQLVLFLDENNQMNSKEAAEEKKEINSLQSELKTCDEELKKCRDNLNSCLERNAKLCREITDLKAILEMQKSAMNDQDSGNEVIKESILELPSIGEQNDDNLEKDTEEVVDLQLEIEILKIILKEERSIRGETEEKFSFITKQYENLREELLEDLKNINKQEYDEILHEKELEIGSLQMQVHGSILKEKENQQELILLREKCEEKDRKFIILSQEFDLLTNKIEEVLTVGHNALDDALDMIGDTKRTRVFEQLQIIARRISEKELRIEELNLCLEDAKNRGNEMDSMLRSLRGATLVMSEAHQQDCIKKDEEIHRLLSDLKEKDYIITQLEEQKKLYELELMDAKLNAAHQVVESRCYLDKFVETQDKIKEADLMIEKLVIENEAMKMEISNQNQVINAKEIELFIMLSKLEQLASENNDLEKEKISVYTVLEKFKEEIIVFHVDKELKDLMSMERKNVEVSLLQKQVDVQEEALKTTQARANENEAITAKEKALYELEFMDAKLNAAQQAVESCIYLDKFVETQHNIKEAESMINKLATENEATKMDIIHQNQVINDKDEELRFLEEKLVTAKEIELLIMLSKLQQMASENNDLEKEKLSVYAVLEKFKEEVIILHVDMKLKDLILMEEDAEVRLLQKQVNVQEEALKMAQARAEENEAIATEEKRLYELELTNAWLSAAQQSVESCCYLDKFVGTQHNIKEADFAVNKLVNENKAMKIEIAAFINEKDMLEKRLKTETMEMKSEIEELEHMILQIRDKLEQVTSEYNDLEKENANLSTVLEKFKEKIIISYADLYLKDSELLEKDAEVDVLEKQVQIHKDENETLLVIINDMKDDIKEFEDSYEALECELYENIVKSLVLEARLTEIVQDALKAKESTEERWEMLMEENETFVVIINDLKDDIKEFEDSYEALECEIYENIVKSLVLEARLTENVQDALKAKELTEGRLEKASLEFTTVLGEKINLIESLKGDMEIVMSERYDLHVELLRAKEELKLAQATAKENEAIAVNAKQVCETSKRYAKEKEEELKLYEKTVEELEFTVDVLRNQVDLVKGDAESQRLKREELQLELQKMYHQEHLLTAKNENFKEENNMLKAQNGEMGHKLRREEATVRRVKEELASFRAAIGKNFS